MTVILYFLLLYIPPIEKFDAVENYELKISQFVSSGMLDSAQRYVKIYLSRADNVQHRKKGLFWEYTINKKQLNIPKTEETFKELLKVSTLEDSILFTRDFVTFLYNLHEFERILDFKNLKNQDDSARFVIALAHTKLGKEDVALEILKENSINEARILKTYLLYRTAQYEEAYKASREIQWNEMALISAPQLGMWDSVKNLFESSRDRLNPSLVPFLDVIYIISLKNLNLNVPEETYQKWISFYGDHPLSNYVLFAYAKDLHKMNKWKSSIEVINLIDTVDLFEKFPSLKIEYFWIKGKNYYYSGGSLKDITKNLQYVLENTTDESVLDSCNFFLGNTYQRINQFKRALSFHQNVKKDSPFYIKSLYNTAYIYFQLSRYAEAIEIVNYILNMNPDQETRVMSLKLKAKIYEVQQNYSSAIQIYRSILNEKIKRNKMYEILYNIEILKFKNGDYKSLDEAYSKYLAKYPESPLAPQIYYDLVFKNVYSRERQEAIKILGDMIRHHPASSKTLEALSLFFTDPLCSLKDTVLLNEYLAKNPKVENDVNYLKGTLFLNNKLYDDAIMYLNKVKGGRYYIDAQAKIMEVYFNLQKYYEVEVIGMEVLPEEIRDFSSYKILTLYLKALKMQGKNDAFNSMVNHYVSKEFPNKKEFCLMLSDIYLQEKDSLNSLKFLIMAKNYGATNADIAKYNHELLKLTGDLR
ncbi:MAG: tetratricopeptide repeat protein [Candidatus Hydrothermae bacterium]|nr:tetratricopeptide repeat protein [Candidatus Hydrothermae bacterium]